MSEVIDGQQRLSTLQILIAAIRDYAISHNSQHASRLKRLTANEDKNPEADSAFEVWPTNADRAVFRTLQTAGLPERLLQLLSVEKSESAPRMAAAYVFFYGKVGEFAGLAASDPDARDSRLFGLLQAVNDPSADADELYERYWRDFDVAEADPPVNGEARFWHVDD